MAVVNGLAAPTPTRVAVLLAACAVLAGCTTRAGGHARAPSPAQIAQARADTLAGVAVRIYYQEVFGSPNASAYHDISLMPGVVAGLEQGDLALARRTLNRVVLRHVVHTRITRGSRTLVDVGLKFVIAGQPRRLLAPDGTYLGRIEVSIQDVIGYVKLVRRLTGAEILVRGRRGHAKASLPALLGAPPPASGPLVLGGRTYYVSSFARAGFADEQLHVWILDPTG
jgi:hypothetical protein